MDWFPLLNSLRIAVISTVVVFFCHLDGALHRKTSTAGERCTGCGADAAFGATAHGGGMAPFDGAWAQAAFGSLGPGDLRRQDGHDLVVRHLRNGSGSLSAHVSHGTGSLREL